MTKTNSHSKVIGIDPGKSGGISVVEDGEVTAHKCPKTVEDMAVLFSIICGDTPRDKIYAVMERVWARPSNASRSAFAYGVNYGSWLGIMASNEVDCNPVLPLKWMQHMGCPKALKKENRKRWLKEKAKELCPYIKRVTLITADSILIAKYAEDILKTNN